MTTIGSGDTKEKLLLDPLIDREGNPESASRLGSERGNSLHDKRSFPHQIARELPEVW